VAYPIVCNIAKGRVAELHNRIQANDPANSAWILIPISVGAVSEAAMRDADNFAAMVTAGVTERSANGWNRKTITDAALAALTPDDTNDRMDIDFPDQTWTPTVGTDTVTHLVLCYDADTTGGTDANLLAACVYDFAITPDGSLVTAEVNAAGYYRAS
jgi:hypothetical protein